MTPDDENDNLIEHLIDILVILFALGVAAYSIYCILYPA